MKEKKLPLIVVAIIVIIIVAGGSFYCGLKYGYLIKGPGQNNLEGFQNLTPEQRQQRLGQMGANGLRGNGSGGDFLNGEIISKDNSSLILKLRAGGSKVVIFATSTEVGKFTNGSVADLSVGQTVSVNGQSNSDGSLTAQSIQIRPALPPNDQQPSKQ
ncbi:MAG: DUF5666 domain-containing protein [Patescibacteria group bacterium]